MLENDKSINDSIAKIASTPSTTRKALTINMNNKIYGTFAEIGAGQETVRHFFRVGGASRTIAKAMSAYDKTFSDSVYGREADGRYVTDKRLRRMLDHETELLEERIKRFQHPDKLFFTYANTVATINFDKRFKGHGWVGIRYQLNPSESYNEIILHIRFHQNEAKLQQETLGVMGVNLIHGAFYLYEDAKQLLEGIYDHINKEDLEVDLINFSGPNFKDVDNRLMSLQLVRNGMTQAVVFNSQRKNVLAGAILYKKYILALRGSFRPVTNVNMEMYEKSLNMFLKQEKVDTEHTEVLFEITLSNLVSGGILDEQDFIDRADLLCSLGMTVIISNFKEYYRLVEYFRKYTNNRIGLTMGVDNLIQVFKESYYKHLSGGILEAFGKLFHENLNIYLYPSKNKSGKGIINSDNLEVEDSMKELYKFFKKGGKIIDIKDYNVETMNIFSRKILKMIEENKTGWEPMLPHGIAGLIKEKNIFGYGVKKENNTQEK